MLLSSLSPLSPPPSSSLSSSRSSSMAVDQVRNLNFFREMLSTSNNYSNNNNNNNINNPMINQIVGNNNLYSNNSNITNSFPPAMNDSLLFPFYNLNDVVFNSGAGKLPPAVKDDSGVTFNNSLVVLPPAATSRKRSREETALPAAMVSGASSIVSKESDSFSFLGEDLSLQIMQQQLELDRLVSQHMEKMRIEIDGRKKQQLRRIMASIEDAMAKKMREKDEEISKLVRINFELEDKVKTLYLQSQIWRDVAQTNEATASALRSNLEQVLHQVRENDAVRTNAAGGGGDLTDDAVSCCGSSGYGGEEEERERENDVDGERWPKQRRICNDDGERWVYRGKKENNGGKRMCKKCGEGESRVLVLPCRHLCLCTLCGPMVNACPICDSAKNASIHVNLS